ncbi:MAG: helix-turn-helix domain-containing protein [Chloroflexota bacterium]
MDRTRNGDARYSLAELTEAARVSLRTVRYYIAEGLLPPPKGSGPASFYTPAHLERLKLIGRLKDAYLPLREIRRRLAGVEDRELAGLLAMSDPELFDPATWEQVGQPRSVTSYLAQVAREKQKAAPGEPAPIVRTVARRAMPQLPPAADDEPADDLEAEDSLTVLREMRALPSEMPSMRMSADLLEWRPEGSEQRTEIDREAGPAWRRLALGDEIELIVSDRAWRRNREKLEWLANWARKVLR